VFEVTEPSKLREWTQALYANWNASKSYTSANSIKILTTKFWKVKSLDF
jgi:hypothetical protein